MMRKTLFILLLLLCINIICNAQNDRTKEFVKEVYIDFNKSLMPVSNNLSIRYICNGYNGHWQFFIGDTKNIYLGYDSENQFPSDTIVLKEYNHSGLSGCVAINRECNKDLSWKPMEPLTDYINQNSTLNIFYIQHVPPFGLSDSIFNFSPKVILQDKTIRNNNENRIPFDKVVINPDNILGVDNSISSITSKHLNADCLNPNTIFGFYRKVTWGDLYNDKKRKYDLSIFNDIFLKCINNNTRLTLRIDQTHGAWDLFTITKPRNWKIYRRKYSKGLDRLGKWSFTEKDELLINGLVVTGDYPSHVFFNQILEGTQPCIIKLWNVFRNDSCYASFFNYNSNSAYREWYRMEKKFRHYIDTKTYVNRYGDKIKAKDLLENLYAAVGITGEGYIRQYGVFPDDINKYVRYYTTFAKLFKDVPTSFPLAASYDYYKLGDEWLRKIWNIRSSNGRYSGLWYDVIGQKGFVPYTTYSNTIFSKLISSPSQRRWCGESDFSDEIGSQLLTHSYIYRFSGVSQHGLPYNRSTTANTQQVKFITLAGAKLFLSNVKLDGTVLKYELQNIGFCRVFSPYWEAYVIYRNDDGVEIGRQKLNVDLFNIEPNDTRYEDVGVYREHGLELTEKLNIPFHAGSISFVIKDKYGVYENYWLHNTDRVSFDKNDIGLKEGEYIIWKRL